MYYNSNKNNNDYYNSYKKELLELGKQRKKENIQGFIKLVLTLLSFILFILTAYYLYKYFNPVLNVKTSFPIDKQQISKHESFAKIIIREEELPQSIQLDDKNSQITADEKRQTISSINEKDIALIVQIIMSQISENVEKPLEKEAQKLNKKKIINQNLEPISPYNKISLSKDEEIKIEDSSLIELSNSFNNIMSEEVLFPKNKMRIIIVQEGDTLSTIAQRAYGSKSHYKKIFTANPELIENPNQIFVGQRLRIPS